MGLSDLQANRNVIAMNTPALIRGRQARSTLPAPLTIAAGRQHTAETIKRAWFEGKSEHTRRSYQHDCEDFAMYLSRALARRWTSTALSAGFFASPHRALMKSRWDSGTTSYRRTWPRRASIAISPRCAP
jgi:hypothetical protein